MGGKNYPKKNKTAPQQSSNPLVTPPTQQQGGQQQERGVQQKQQDQQCRPQPEQQQVQLQQQGASSTNPRNDDWKKGKNTLQQSSVTPPTQQQGDQRQERGVQKQHHDQQRRPQPEQKRVQSQQQGAWSTRSRNDDCKTEMNAPKQSSNTWRANPLTQQQSGQRQNRGSQQQQHHHDQRRPQTERKNVQPQHQGAWPKQPTQSKNPVASTSDSIKKQPQKPSAYVLPSIEELEKSGIEVLKVSSKEKGSKGYQLGLVETNYVRLSIKNVVDNIYHYDIEFRQYLPKKLSLLVFKKFFETNYSDVNVYVAFDGKNNAYATRKLKIDRLEQSIKIIHPETGRELNFDVSLKEADTNFEIPFKSPLIQYTDKKCISDTSTVQGLDIILKSAFRQEHLKFGMMSGRSFILPRDLFTKQCAGTIRRDLYLGEGCELRFGLFQSVVLGDELFLNVDVAHKAIAKRYSSLVDLLKDFANDLRYQQDYLNAPWPKYFRDALQRHLSGLDICYNQPGTNNKSVRKCLGIENKPQDEYFDSHGVHTSVQNYFNERGTQIKYKELPCLCLGSKDRNIAVPLEFCSIPEQVSNKKCTEKQTSNMIGHAATDTKTRKQRIMDLLHAINHNRSETIQGFGLNIGDQFEKVPARQLLPPTIEYKDGKFEKPSKGAWKADNKLFLHTEQYRDALNWGILNTSFQTKSGDLYEFQRMLYRESNKKGLNFCQMPIYNKTIEMGDRFGKVSKQQIQKLQTEFEAIAKENKVRILFCVVPDKGAVYSHIKQMAEYMIRGPTGVLTQCIKARTLEKKVTDPSTMGNIILKVNAKLNGTNHKLNVSPIIQGKRCMFVGADVSHPSPDQRIIPSVVGVVSSYDEHGFKYKAEPYYQPSKMEIIQNFKEIMKSHLKFYMEKNGELPEKIFYYRDGVSESQFAQVMAIERNDIALACADIKRGDEKQVEMIVVIVQKRHHTRFFPCRETKIKRGEEDRNNNVPAGTIVDSTITRPNQNDFYLVSHQSIQGVAKPTKYCILLDEGNHKSDDLQELTNHLCYLYTRCNRAVSYPSPTYYAHHAAKRGRVHIENQDVDLDDLKNENAIRRVKANIADSMYFV